MANDSALALLKDLTHGLLDARGLYVDEGTARVVLDDPEWQKHPSARADMSRCCGEISRVK